MNKFKNLAGKLLKNPLWSSKIKYYQVEMQKTGIAMPEKPLIKNVVDILCVIGSVSKNLVDNEKIFNTDSSIVIDSLTLVPSKYDFVEINNERYKIVAIMPLGIMDNEPTAFEIVLRVA
jgi:hypothetical protein